MKVRVLKLGHSAREVEIAAGATVEEALKSARMETDGYSVTVNGVGAMLTAQVREGDVITLAPKVEGGKEEPESGATSPCVDGTPSQPGCPLPDPQIMGSLDLSEPSPELAKSERLYL